MIFVQEKLIRSKKRVKVKPVMGILLRQRLGNSQNRKSWGDLVGSSVPRARSIEQVRILTMVRGYPGLEGSTIRDFFEKKIVIGVYENSGDILTHV